MTTAEPRYTIFLDEKDMAEIASIRQTVERELIANCNLSGARVEIEAGDATYVEGGDELVGASLLCAVHNALQPSEEE